MENNEIKVSEMVECSDILDDDLLMIIQNRANKKISFKTIEKAILKVSFPIGSTYITQTNTNPSEILGFGTWERVKGRVLVGIDEDDDNFATYGKEGGEATHTLTTDEIPALTNQKQVEKLASFGEYVQAPTGKAQPHNILQPYKVVGYMWIRTA